MAASDRHSDNGPHELRLETARVWTMRGLRYAGGTLVVFAIVAAVGATCPFSTVRSQLDRFAGDGSADAYTTEVHGRFRTGLAGLAVSTTVLVLILWQRRALLLHHGTQFFIVAVEDARQVRTDFGRAIRRNMVGLLVAAVAATAMRLPHLTVPIRYDEAHTYVKYASQPPFLIVTQYDEPNNHILHSLLVHLSTRVWGDGVTAIRLPALASGVLLAMVGVLWGAAVAGRGAGLVCGLLIAAWPALVEYSVNARGYMPATLLCSVVCLAAGHARRRQNLVSAAVAGCGIALSLWTIPSMLYAAIAIVVATAVQSLQTRPRGHRLWSGLAITALGAGLLTLLLWLPTILGVGLGKLIAIGGGAPLDWSTFTTRTPAYLMNAGNWLIRDVPLGGAAVLVLGGVSAVVSRRSRVRAAAWGSWAGLAAIGVLLLLQRVLPFARTWCFLIPPGLVLGVAGGRELIAQALSRRAAAAVCAVAGLLLVAAVAWSSWNSDWIAVREQAGTFRDAQAVMAFLQTATAPQEPVITVTPASAPLVYHARQLGFPEVHFLIPGRAAGLPPTAIVVCSVPEQQTPRRVLSELQLDDLYDAASAESLAAIGTARLFRVPRRNRESNAP